MRSFRYIVAAFAVAMTVLLPAVACSHGQVAVQSHACCMSSEALPSEASCSCDAPCLITETDDPLVAPVPSVSRQLVPRYVSVYAYEPIHDAPSPNSGATGSVGPSQALISIGAVVLLI